LQNDIRLNIFIPSYTKKLRYLIGIFAHQQSTCWPKDAYSNK